MLLLHRVPDQRRLLVRRKGEIDDLDVCILDQLFRRVVHRWDAPAGGDLLGVRPGARGDRRHRKAGLLVSRQMALGHNHAGADAADPVFLGANLNVRLEAFAYHVFLPKFCPRGRAHNAPPS